MLVIKSIHITCYQENTWGRVYVTYSVDGQQAFIFKNWIKGEEHTYKGVGMIEMEPSYKWFSDSNKHIFSKTADVLNGSADHLTLTPPKFAAKYGTPSKILKKLLIELKANIGEPVIKRRHWYIDVQQTPILSPIVVGKNSNIYLPTYDTEISLDPLHKTVYILFLSHPEGLLLKHFINHEQEIGSIYNKIRREGEKFKIQSSIKKLSDARNNSLLEKIARIKNLIYSELGEILGKYYTISGSRGKEYRILLPKTLIKLDEWQQAQ